MTLLLCCVMVRYGNSVMRCANWAEPDFATVRWSSSGTSDQLITAVLVTHTVWNSLVRYGEEDHLAMSLACCQHIPNLISKSTEFKTRNLAWLVGFGRVYKSQIPRLNSRSGLLGNLTWFAIAFITVVLIHIVKRVKTEACQVIFCWQGLAGCTD